MNALRQAQGERGIEMIEDCTALILAGGDSRRMGQDKAALLLDGKTLLESVAATMQQVFPKVVVSVRQLRGEVALPQVCDAQADGGPLAGLVAGLAQVDTPWVFTVACDMPFIQPSVIEQLAMLRDGHQAVVSIAGGFPQPLAAFYATSSLPVMRTSLASGNKSLRGMLQNLDVRYVDAAELQVSDPRSFFDLDTPQDYAAAREQK